MDKVAVIMSTYNGEKYLREQLDSVFAQKGVCIDLYVRDDGSSDGTKNILDEYSNKYNNIYINYAENVGVGNSFMNALYSVNDEYDFYAFCDQDDVWAENKLLEACLMLKKNGKMLYSCNLEYVDKDLKTISFRDDSKIYIEPVNILAFDMLAGCTVVITKEFYNILTAEDRRPSAELLRNRIHDVWTVMVASIYEGIIYDRRSFIKYRQHGNNTSGGVKLSHRKVMKLRFKKLFNKELRNCRSNLAKEICLKYPDKASKFKEIEICASANKFSSKKWIIRNNKKFRENTNEGHLFFVFKVLFGII